MSSIIRYMEEKDRSQVVEMMRTFYASPAVSTNGSEEIFQADIDNCLSDSPYIEGYVFEDSGILQGYGMIVKSFATEFGKPCKWIEDLYIRSEYRGQGIGTMFLKYAEEKYPDSVFRLEAEPENERAVSVYRKFGYDTLPYMEMKKLI